MKTIKRINLEQALEELKHEIEDIQNDESLKINSVPIMSFITEDILIKKLWSLIDKSSELTYAVDDIINETKEKQ